MNAMDVSYLSSKEAASLVHRRFADSGLRRAVAQYVGFVPDFLNAEPFAFSTRQIATPNFEHLRFLSIAQELGLRPLCWEFTGDKFLTLNSVKRSYGRMCFFERLNSRNEPIIRFENVIDLIEAENQPFEHIRTVWGEGLVDFHHRLLSGSPADGMSMLYDATSWYHANGEHACDFYSRALAIFLCFGVLVESFLIKGEEHAFTMHIVIPALAEIRKVFGLDPLIVPIAKGDDFDDVYSLWYPGNMRSLLQSRIV